jgi:hypothetical protein
MSAVFSLADAPAVSPHKPNVIRLKPLVLVFGLGPLAAWAVSNFLRLYHVDWWILDDALIYLRYVDHFLAGCGLNFNCYPNGLWGGGPVAGYTSTAWVLLMIPARWLTRSGLPAFTLLRLMSLTVALLVPLLLVWRWRRPGWETEQYLAFGAVFFSPFNMCAWSIAGMDTSLVWLYYALLLVVPLDQWRGWRLWALGACTYWIRPDLVLAAAVHAAWLLSADWRRAWRFAVAVLAGAASNALFLYAQYGMWLPNTFYAKSGGSARFFRRGLRHLGEFALDYWPILLLAALLTILAASRRATRRWELLRPWLLCLAPVAFVLYSGGDIFPGQRHLTPVLVVLLLVIGEWAFRFRWRGTVLVLALLVAAISASYAMPGVKAAVDHTRRDRIAYAGVDTAKLLQEAEPQLGPAAVVAITSAGGHGWATPCEVLDALGLNDKVVARHGLGIGGPGHDHYDENYLLQVQPDVIFFNGRRGKPTFVGEKRLFVSPRFKALYRLRNYSRIQYYRHIRWERPSPEDGTAEAADAAPEN